MERRADLGTRLQRFRDCHRGERLVLVCNGPSLNQTDFSLIRREVSMGLNKIFLGFRRLRFYPGLIQSVSQAFLPGLRAWVEVGGIASSQCLRAFLPQPISI